MVTRVVAQTRVEEMGASDLNPAVFREVADAEQMQPPLRGPPGRVRAAQGQTGADVGKIAKKGLHHVGALRSGNELHVAGRVEVLDQVLLLGEPIGLDRVEVGVDVGRSVPRCAGRLFMIAEALLEVLRLADVLMLPTADGILLAEDVVADLLGKDGSDRVDLMGVAFPGLAGPVAGRCVSHSFSLDLGAGAFSPF